MNQFDDPFAPVTIEPVVMPDITQDEQTVTTSDAAAIIGITQNHLRQMVFKKRLTPAGRKGRSNTFYLWQVQALREERDKKATITP